MDTERNGIGIVLLEGGRCRCGHEWLPRAKGERPRVCPKCKSPNWDRPYQHRGDTEQLRRTHPPDAAVQALDALADDALREHQQGRTRNLRDFAREYGISPDE